MDTVLAFVRSIVSTRGAQLISRYVAMGIVSLGTKLAMDPATVNANATAESVAAFVVAAVLFGIDHWSHKEQAK